VATDPEFGKVSRQIEQNDLGVEKMKWEVSPQFTRARVWM
jgi:hypothetical protein